MSASISWGKIPSELHIWYPAQVLCLFPKALVEVAQGFVMVPNGRLGCPTTTDKGACAVLCPVGGAPGATSRASACCKTRSLAPAFGRPSPRSHRRRPQPCAPRGCTRLPESSRLLGSAAPLFAASLGELLLSARLGEHHLSRAVQVLEANEHQQRLPRSYSESKRLT
jgi:hypothetical protein